MSEALKENTEFPTLAARAAAWVRRCFGDAAMARPERAARLMEEAIELAQAEGVPEELAAGVVRRVYSRPSGLPAQEAGGVGLCLAAWEEASGISVENAAMLEMDRVERMSVEHFKARHAAKVAVGAAAPPGVRPPIALQELVDQARAQGFRLISLRKKGEMAKKVPLPTKAKSRRDVA